MATNQQQTTVLELPHTLTSEEKLGQQNQIMQHLDSRADLDDELTAATARFKRDKADIDKRVKEVDKTINKLRGEIKVGVEMRKYKCNIIRDRDAREVRYVVIDGHRAGDVVKTHEFTQEDWDAVLDDSQGDLFADEDTEGGEPADLRSKASLTDEGPVQPNEDENGNVVAGPDTDRYNQENPGDTTYQHLSGDADFKPVIPMYQQDGTHAEGGLAGDGSEPTSAPDVDSDDTNDTNDTSDDDSEDDEDDDDNGDDEPQAPTPPAPPRRRARRTGEPKE